MNAGKVGELPADVVTVLGGSLGLNDEDVRVSGLLIDSIDSLDSLDEVSGLQVQ
jgi:hypothetical protein